MGKKLNCREMGMDCDFVARGETVEEVLKVAVEHSKNVHGLTELSPEMEEKAKSIIKEE